MNIAPSALTLDLIREAAAYLNGRIRRTPVEFSPGLSDIAGVPVWLKLESMQLTGSFKIRGALFRISKLTAQEVQDGVVTCSAGNHGKAVAYAAREAGVRATICVPRSVDRAKYQGMVALGADVRVSEFDGYDDTEEWARKMAAGEGRAFLSAFDDYAVMAANGGTVAMEVMEDAPDARAFILPVGGGGLSGGFAFWAKSMAQVTVVGCQLDRSPALRLSLDSGHAVTRLPAVETMAAGVEGGIGGLTFEVLRSRVDRVVLVSEEEILDAVRWMLEHHQYLIEPTAAVPIAAVLAGKIGALTAPAVIVVSGRNVSSEAVRKILCVGTNSGIVGTWKLVSAVGVTQSGETHQLLGENPSGFLTYTGDGRMSVLLSTGGRRPLSVEDTVAAPVAERAEAFATFDAYAGRYTFEGDRVIHHIEVCLFQNWVGTDQVRSVKLEGNRLTLKSQPILVGGEQLVAELIWEK